MFETAVHYLGIASDAIDSVGMSVAILLLAGILAAVGGMLGWRGRIYGAVVGAMIMNAVVKAQGGGYAAALVAAILVAAVAIAFGSTPFLLQLLRRTRRG